MNTIRKEDIISTGLAIFSMLFGAGNLMYPLQVGMESGPLTLYGMIGFLLTGVILPLVGLIGMILFDGNYKSFFNRLGTLPGGALLFASIMVIGPVIAIPRITTLSHIMIAPFLPSFFQVVTPFSSFLFSIIFLGITFLSTYRENKIVTILGRFISPLLLLSLLIIIALGIIQGNHLTLQSYSAWPAFKNNLIRGYETLDLLGAIFFASIVLTILKRTIGNGCNPRILAKVGLQAGVIGISLLAMVYIGMSIIGAYHGHNLAGVNAGELFRAVSFTILGPYGMLLIASTVFMACLSTAIALSAVVAEYTEKILFRRKISYLTALIIITLSSIPLSTFGLGKVLSLAAGPIVYIGYPVIITLTACNIAYKLFNVNTVKTPVFLAFLISLVSYYVY